MHVWWDDKGFSPCPAMAPFGSSKRSQGGELSDLIESCSAPSGAPAVMSNPGHALSPRHTLPPPGVRRQGAAVDAATAYLMELDAQQQRKNMYSRCQMAAPSAAHNVKFEGNYGLQTLSEPPWTSVSSEGQQEPFLSEQNSQTNTFNRGNGLTSNVHKQQRAYVLQQSAKESVINAQGRPFEEQIERKGSSTEVGLQESTFLEQNGKNFAFGGNLMPAPDACFASNLPSSASVLAAQMQLLSAAALYRRPLQPPGSGKDLLSGGFEDLSAPHTPAPLDTFPNQLLLKNRSQPDHFLQPQQAGGSCIHEATEGGAWGIATADASFLRSNSGLSSVGDSNRNAENHNIRNIDESQKMFPVHCRPPIENSSRGMIDDTSREPIIDHQQLPNCDVHTFPLEEAPRRQTVAATPLLLPPLPAPYMQFSSSAHNSSAVLFSGSPGGTGSLRCNTSVEVSSSAATSQAKKNLLLPEQVLETPSLLEKLPEPLMVPAVRTSSKRKLVQEESSDNDRQVAFSQTLLRINPSPGCFSAPAALYSPRLSSGGREAMAPPPSPWLEPPSAFYSMPQQMQQVPELQQCTLPVITGGPERFLGGSGSAGYPWTAEVGGSAPGGVPVRRQKRRQMMTWRQLQMAQDRFYRPAMEEGLQGDEEKKFSLEVKLEMLKYEWEGMETLKFLDLASIRKPLSSQLSQQFQPHI